MKRLVPLALLVIAASSVLAQRRGEPLRGGKTEVGLSYGFASMQEWASALADVIVTVGTGGYILAKSYSPFGPIAGSYDYYASDLLSLGAEASYFTIKRDFSEVASGGSAITTRENFYTAQGKFDLHWWTIGDMEFSSGLAVGAGLISQRVLQNDSLDGATAWFPAFNVGLVRIRGGSDIGVFAELGFGTRGTFVVGINRRY